MQTSAYEGGSSFRSRTGSKSVSTSSHRFTQQGTASARPEPKAWVTVPVPDENAGIHFRPRGFGEDGTTGSIGSTAWDIKSRYMMAARSGPTECPDHLMAKHREFQRELETFPSPYALYYFDETAPNNLLLANDLKAKNTKPDYQRVPTKKQSGSGKSKKDAMDYEVRKLFFDVDDIRVPDNGTGLKLLPSYTVSYKNYPAVCYDVLAPKDYTDFFRVRARPGMFA